MTKNITNWSLWQTFFLNVLLIYFIQIDFSSAENNIDDFHPRNKTVSQDDDDPRLNADYVYVVLKTPIESWRDGSRSVAALADMLNMENYFTFSRLDRHEILFRVEENPEKKTAADVSRAINDSRFKNNLTRRLGIIVIRAGVGDKTNIQELSDNNEIEKLNSNREEDEPNVTHKFIYVLGIGIGLATAIVIVVMLSFNVFFRRRYNNKRNKRGRLQADLKPAEASSNDFQELGRSDVSALDNNSPSARRIPLICKDIESTTS